jgi:hypothetical protein
LRGGRSVADNSHVLPRHPSASRPGHNQRHLDEYPFTVVSWGQARLDRCHTSLLTPAPPWGRADALTSRIRRERFSDAGGSWLPGKGRAGEGHAAAGRSEVERRAPPERSIAEQISTLM